MSAADRQTSDRSCDSQPGESLQRATRLQTFEPSSLSLRPFRIDSGLMKYVFAVIALCASVALGQENRPLTSLPYTPSLDVPSMDKSADPCNDFYQFTCGGWMASNPIPPDQAAWSVYGKLEEENTQYLWGVLEDDAKPSADRNAVQQKIGDYFAACMDTSAIEKLGAQPLQPL